MLTQLCHVIIEMRSQPGEEIEEMTSESTPWLSPGVKLRIVVSGGSLLTSLTACLSLTFVYAGSSFFRPDLGFATRVSVVVCREGDVRPDPGTALYRGLSP